MTSLRHPGCGKFEYMDGTVARTVTVPHKVTVNNSPACGAACRAGFGISQLPLQGVASYLKSGLLVEVLPDYLPAAMPINHVMRAWLYHQNRDRAARAGTSDRPVWCR